MKTKKIKETFIFIDEIDCMMDAPIDGRNDLQCYTIFYTEKGKEKELNFILSNN
jgi:hypothetical protein